jgi:hypothetical protein
VQVTTRTHPRVHLVRVPDPMRVQVSISPVRQLPAGSTEAGHAPVHLGLGKHPGLLEAQVPHVRRHHIQKDHAQESRAEKPPRPPW